jgi:heme-degrading monooxygenase HmoA
VYLATFEFEQVSADEEWRALNAEIQRAAEGNEAYAERSVWTSPDGDRTLVVYRWETLEGLQAFREHPTHREAKRRYEEWYDGFEVTIAEVLTEYRDGGLDGEQ